MPSAILVVNGNDGNDDIVLANPGVPTGLTGITVNAGNGNDIVSVYVAPQGVTLNGDGGDDLFRVTPSVSGIAVDGGGQVLGDLLMVDATAGKATDTGTAVEVDGFAPVDYVDVEGVQRVTKGKQKKILKKILGF